VNDTTAAFVCELSRTLQKNGSEISVLVPHFPGGQTTEIWHSMHIFRFVYFLPTGLERLAYGPGLLFNAKRNFLAFIEIPFFIVAEFFWTALLLRAQKIQIIHSHWLIPQGLIGAFFSRLYGIPHIVSVHGSDLILFKKNKFLNPLCQFIVQHADRITVNSSYTKKQLEAIVPAASAKVSVIPMGINPQKFGRTGSSELRRKYNASHIILSVGRLIDIKGTIYLIRALPKILSYHPRTVLLIAGDGPEKEKIYRESMALGLEKNVFFLGFVRRTEVPILFGDSDIFVIPSIDIAGHTEAQGIVVLEAMASGCPIIGSNVGGIPDMVRDGVNGFLVPEKDHLAIADAINRLLANPLLQEKFRRNGLLTVHESFTWEKIGARFLELFSDIVRERQGLHD
jgi:glycosyltransferase involved in cell wall biosynthesis